MLHPDQPLKYQADSPPLDDSEITVSRALAVSYTAGAPPEARYALQGRHGPRDIPSSERVQGPHRACLSHLISPIRDRLLCYRHSLIVQGLSSDERCSVWRRIRLSFFLLS